jgi:hypothetical protein
MRQLLTALPVLILLIAGNAFGLQGSHEWIKYDSPEGGYSVLLPGQPNLTTQEAATAKEKSSHSTWPALPMRRCFSHRIFRPYSGNNVFPRQSTRQYYSVSQGNLVSEGSISLGGSPGRELKVSLTGADGVEYGCRPGFMMWTSGFTFCSSSLPRQTIIMCLPQRQ